MARRKNWSAEQIVAKLRQIEVQIAQGKSLALACKEAEISEHRRRWNSSTSGGGPPETRHDATSSLTWRATTIDSGSIQPSGISHPRRPSGEWQANRIHQSRGRSGSIHHNPYRQNDGLNPERP